MNILFLCHRIPYPPDKGDKIRSFNEIKYLSKKHKIFLVCLIDKKEDTQYVSELKRYCEAVDYDEINPKWQKIKSIPYLLTTKPLTVSYFYSGKLQHAIDKRLSEIEFDVIFVFSSPMAEYILKSKLNPPTPPFGKGGQGGILKGDRKNRQAKLIMDFVDVDSDKWRMYSEYSSFPKSLIYKNEWKRLMTYEKKVGETFDVSVFVSDAEVKLFKSFAPDVKAVSIPNGVDVEYFKDVRNVRSVRDVQTSATIERAKRLNNSNILFIGAMDYFPNEDGVLYFYHNIWPTIKKKLPYAKFYIVGRNPSKKLKIISKKNKDIIVTGQVNDIRQYMQKADIFVAPLRIARGIQNKVLEAMASGLPVVATPQVMQGIKYDSDDSVFIEDTDEKFVQRTIDLAKRKLEKNTLKKRKSFLKHKYNWEENMTLLEKIVVGDF